MDTLVESAGLRAVLEALTVVTGFGLVAVWRRQNRIALDLQRARRRDTVRTRPRR